MENEVHPKICIFKSYTLKDFSYETYSHIPADRVANLTSMLSAEGQKLHVLIGNNEGIHVYEFNSQTVETNFESRNTESSSGVFYSCIKPVAYLFG